MPPSHHSQGQAIDHGTSRMVHQTTFVVSFSFPRAWPKALTTERLKQFELLDSRTVEKIYALLKVYYKRYNYSRATEQLECDVDYETFLENLKNKIESDVIWKTLIQYNSNIKNGIDHYFRLHRHENYSDLELAYKEVPDMLEKASRSYRALFQYIWEKQEKHFYHELKR